MAKLPVQCVELGLRFSEGRVAVVNSRAVANVFGKRHADVLRSIDELLTDAKLRSSDWFWLATYEDTKGEKRRSFDMTRDGFALLVFGWTGEKALQFKVRYIDAFNAMEAALQDGSTIVAPATERLVDAVKAGIREIVAPLATRLEHHMGKIAEDVASLKHRLGPKRISKAVKAEHVDAIGKLGGRCPCCGVAEVVTAAGVQSPFAEFDHFYQNQLADEDHTWLICKPDHADLTTGRVSRVARERDFHAYQEKRQRLPGRQPKLF